MTYDDVGPGAGIAISDFNHGNTGLVGGAMLCNEFIRLPYQFVGQVPPDVPRWGQAHKEFMRHFYRRSMAVQGPTQEVPAFHNRLQLDPKIRDHWGIPVARLSGSNHAKNVETGFAMARNAEKWLKEAGAIKTWLKRPGHGTDRRPAPGRHLPHGFGPEGRPWSTRGAACMTSTTSM